MKIKLIDRKYKEKSRRIPKSIHGMKKPHRVRCGNVEQKPSPMDGSLQPAGFGLTKFLKIRTLKVTTENQSLTLQTLLNKTAKVHNILISHNILQSAEFLNG